MLNTYPRWKYLLVLFTLLAGLVYSLPNIYGEDPAVQISASSNEVLDDDKLAQIKDVLAAQKIQVKSVEKEHEQILVRFLKSEDQLPGKDLIKAKLGSNYTVALNLAPVTPKWLQSLGAEPMKLGLDLRGGVHFLLEIDDETAINRSEDSFYNDMRKTLMEKNLRYTSLTHNPGEGIKAIFKDAATRDEAFQALSSVQGALDFTRSQTDAGFIMSANLKPAQAHEIRNSTVEQSITTLRNRVNELGVAEALVQRQGLNRVVVELPGIQDTARAKELLGKTATLEFMMQDEEHDVLRATQGKVPPGSKLLYDRHERPVLLKNKIILSGDAITGAMTSTDRDGRPAVSIRVAGAEVKRFTNVTKENIGKNMGVVYIESAVNHELVNGELVKKLQKTEKVISVATIQQALGYEFQITGLNFVEAKNLALMLRAGALPAAISIVEERTVGPSLGQENIEQGVQSIVLGLALVIFIMGIYYHLFGMIANAALVVNLVLLVAVLSIADATLTLPGIAGIVLTLGMAVDSNVLIFERIREEMRNGMSIQASIYSGFERALATIVDSNITTLIVAIILFSVGSGPVRGFAVTLSIGIATSMFTAIMVTRALVNLCYGNRNVQKLSIGI